MSQEILSSVYLLRMGSFIQYVGKNISYPLKRNRKDVCQRVINVGFS